MVLSFFVSGGFRVVGILFVLLVRAPDARFLEQSLRLSLQLEPAFSVTGSEFPRRLVHERSRAIELLGLFARQRGLFRGLGRRQAPRTIAELSFRFRRLTQGTPGASFRLRAASLELVVCEIRCIPESGTEGSELLPHRVVGIQALLRLLQ
jgi:hypothetical protein